MAEFRAVAELWMGEEVGPLLMLRSSAHRLFQKVATLRAERVVVDFSRVEFMSRSFADEYLSRKAESAREIQERNVAPKVMRKFQAVARGGAPTRSPQPDTSVNLSGFDLTPVTPL